MKKAILLWSGSICTVLVSSVCCWLPALALTVGVSSVAIPWFFVKYRSYFLLLSVSLLAGAVYLAWSSARKKRALAGSSCCASDKPGCNSASSTLPVRKRNLAVPIALISLIAVAPLLIQCWNSVKSGCLGLNDANKCFVYEISGQNLVRDALSVQESIEAFAGVESVKSFYGQSSAKLLLKIDTPAQREALAGLLRKRGYVVAVHEPLSAEESSAFLAPKCHADEP